jgi:uncharacterized membrane protein
MEAEDMKLLNNFLHDDQVVALSNKEISKLADKIDLIVKQIMLQEQFNKDLQELRKQLDDLEEKNK